MPPVMLETENGTAEMVRLVPDERVQWIDEQIVKVFSSKEGFLTKMDELRTQLDKVSKKIDAPRIRIKDLRPDRTSLCGEFPCCMWRRRRFSPDICAADVLALVMCLCVQLFLKRGATMPSCLNTVKQKQRPRQ